MSDSLLELNEHQISHPVKLEHTPLLLHLNEQI